MLLLTVLLVSTSITIALMPFFISLAYRLQAVDEPNSRKVHKSIMPKCGGMAMAIGAMTPIVLWGPMTPFTKAVLLGAIVIVTFGVMDDIKDLNPMMKFSGQIAVALIAIFVGGIKISSLGNILPVGVVLPDWLAIPLTIFVIVGATNATNLADGLDGLAGGISLLIFICIGYLAFCEKYFPITIFSIAIGGAILGFLRFNTYPAKLFMGDAGSQLLGFLAILFSINLTQKVTQLNVLLPLLIMGLPILDTLTVMIKRLANGISPFVADKNHFHHKLTDMGLYHTEAVLSIYVIQSVFIILAITLRHASEWQALATYLIYSGCVISFFYVTSIKKYRLNRNILLHPIKMQLRSLRDGGTAIKFSFRIVEVGFPTLLLANCLLAAPPSKVYLFVFGALCIIIMLMWSLKTPFLDTMIRLGLYLITPFLVYASDRGIHAYMDSIYVKLYHFSYLILFLFVILTLNLTRRATRFKSSPMDFLTVFIIMLIPNLPNTELHDYFLGLVAAKTIVLFFSYEVLKGELRLKSRNLSFITAMLMILLASVKIIL
ncbi:MAG: undecaprenyl/decaprenyl-phosphate alpha-N-acetylglucosaminyl 1-phosphate transferase [Proteobacteria bacterium]|nr:undecaprenyl/decaprenyl-phosphate alpha-N-acetylglucosaminyl 1-phosphate transferase [Pseudomonadota bacterium]